MYRARRTCNYSFAEGAKRCEKGKACSATCIYRGDVCQEDFPEKLQPAIKKFRDHLKAYVDRGGSKEVVESVVQRMEKYDTSSAMFGRLSKAMEEMEKEYPDEAKREKRMAELFDMVFPAVAKKGDTGEKQYNTAEEIDHLVKNPQVAKFEKVYQDVKSGKLKTPEEVNEALRPMAEERRKNKISEADLDFAMAIMPKEVVSGLQSQGGPGEWGAWGANQKTTDVPEGGHTPKNTTGMERARLITRIGLEEGMKDVYTGRQLGFGDVDLEHIVPFNVGGKAAEVGSNFGLTSRLNNRGKGNVSPEDWKAGVLKKYPVDEKGQLTPAAAKKLLADEAKAVKYNADRGRMTKTEAKDVADIFKAIEASGESTMTRQKLKNKAMSSLAKYGETYLVGERANRAGQFRRQYIFRGTKSGEEVLDKAANLVSKYAAEGNDAGVAKVLNTLNSAAGRINSQLDSQFGPTRKDMEAGKAGTAAHAAVLKEILGELE